MTTWHAANSQRGNGPSRSLPGSQGPSTAASSLAGQPGASEAVPRDPLRLAAARLAAEYVCRAEAWAGDVDQALVVDLERVHQRLLEHIHDVTGTDEGAEDLRSGDLPNGRPHVSPVWEAPDR